MYIVFVKKDNYTNTNKIYNNIYVDNNNKENIKKNKVK